MVKWTGNVDADGNNLEIIDENGKFVVGGCGCCGSPFTDKELAQTHLNMMLAAPNMYEALIAISVVAQEELNDLGAIIQEGGEWSDRELTNVERWNLVLNAIAKAEGRQ